VRPVERDNPDLSQLAIENSGLVARSMPLSLVPSTLHGSGDRRSVARRNRFGFLKLHLATAALESAVARFVAQDFRAAAFANISLPKLGHYFDLRSRRSLYRIER
jgi:hypothetical protein